MMSKMLATVSMIFVIGGAVYFVKYIEHQKSVIAALDERIKILETKVFPPKPEPKTVPPKKSTRKSQK